MNLEVSPRLATIKQTYTRNKRTKRDTVRPVVPPPPPFPAPQSSLSRELPVTQRRPILKIAPSDYTQEERIESPKSSAFSHASDTDGKAKSRSVNRGTVSSFGSHVKSSNVREAANHIGGNSSTQGTPNFADGKSTTRNTPNDINGKSTTRKTPNSTEVNLILGEVMDNTPALDPYEAPSKTPRVSKLRSSSTFPPPRTKGTVPTIQSGMPPGVGKHSPAIPVLRNIPTSLLPFPSTRPAPDTGTSRSSVKTMERYKITPFVPTTSVPSTPVPTSALQQKPHRTLIVNSAHSPTQQLLPNLYQRSSPPSKPSADVVVTKIPHNARLQMAPAKPLPSKNVTLVPQNNTSSFPSKRCNATRSPSSQGSVTSNHKISCRLEELNGDMAVVEYVSTDGCIYKGVLLKQVPSLENSFPNQYNGTNSVDAHQLPSRHIRKLKSKLGMTFDNSRDSETSDTESITKMNLKKLKPTESKVSKPSKLPPNPPKKPGFGGSKNPASANQKPKSVSGIVKNLLTSTKTTGSGSNSGSSNKTQDERIPCKPVNPPKMPTNSPKTPNKTSRHGLYTTTSDNKTKRCTEELRRMFLKSIMPDSEPGPSWRYKEPPPLPQQPNVPASPNYAQEFLIKATTTPRNTPLQQDWPLWCPRSLKLEVPCVRRGVPRSRRLKMEPSANGTGAKRRKLSGSLKYEEQVKIEYSNKNNPFGIGDVVVSRRLTANGKPFWPAKVLSTTGLTVCVAFYNTEDVLQVAKSNVEWYYDGCLAHKLYKSLATKSKEWMEALKSAENDINQSIGIDSIVWGEYEGDWWPAKVLDLTQDHKFKYKVIWLDNDSIEPLPTTSIAPFLLGYRKYFSRNLAHHYENYLEVVNTAYQLALQILLETKYNSLRGRS